MKILMLLEHEFPGDVRVDREVDSLQKDGKNIDVIICSQNNKGFRKDEYKWGNVYSNYIPKYIMKFSALALTFPIYFNYWETIITKIVKENKYDYIHLHDLPLIKVAHKISKQYNIPLVVDLHENRPEIMKLYKHVISFPGKYLISLEDWFNYQKKYVPLVDKLILITPEAKEYYINNFNVPSEIIAVVPNYVNLPIETEPYNVEITNKLRQKKAVVYFGDISERRGIIEVIEVAIIQKNNPNFHFVFIGGGSGVSKLREIVKKENLKNVDILGFIPIKKALSIIESCSIGICPFHRNIHHDTTYANKMFQYMGLGLPIIVSDCPSQAKIVLKENAGVVFEAGNSIDLNNKLLELTNSDSNFESISKNNQKLIKEKYNWDIGVKDLLQIYNP